MIFDEVLQVVENTTSNFSERADAKHSGKRKFNSFQFHSKEGFLEIVLLHFSFSNHILQKPIRVLSANELFSRQKNWKGINTKNDIGGKYLIYVIVHINFCKKKGTKKIMSMTVLVGNIVS